MIAALVLCSGLVVVAPRDFVPALAPYLEHRRREMPVEVLVVEEAATRDGADGPERVKRVLFERWKAGTCSAVLLVGDVGFVPVRWMTLDRVTPAAFDTAFYPSDLYYGDVARDDGTFDDWNGAREGVHALYFGEVHGEHHKTPPVNFDAISYVPEIAVGRWPARSAEEAAACAAKTIAFERERAPERRAAFVHKDGWVDVRARLAALVQRFPADRAVMLADVAGAPVGAARVQQCLREATTLVLHTGHALPAGWDGAFGLGDRAGVLDLAPRSILVSAGCSSAAIATEPPYQGYLDVLGIEHPGTNAGEVFATWPPPPAPLQPAHHDATSLGEELVRGPGPVAAYFGCTTGSQPAAVTLVEEFAAALPEAARLGDLWLAAVRGYHRRENLAAIVPTEDWYPASIYFQAMKFVLLGDPTLRL